MCIMISVWCFLFSVSECEVQHLSECLAASEEATTELKGEFIFVCGMMAPSVCACYDVHVAHHLQSLWLHKRRLVKL